MANPAANATGHLAAHGMHPCVVTHGATAGTARPAIDSASDAITTVWWVGSVAPTNAVTGDHWTDTTNLVVKRYNGASWDALGPGNTAWTAYTPTLTNITVGNGSMDAAYLQIGKTVYVRFFLFFGSTTTIAATATFSLPFTSKSTSDQALAGTYNAGANIGTLAGRVSAATATCQLAAATAPVSATVPVTWTTNNGITITGVYESA